MSVIIASVRTPVGVADRDERLGEAASVRLGLHERAAAGFHVEHQAVDPLRDLLAHDRRADERGCSRPCRSRRAARTASGRPGRFRPSVRSWRSRRVGIARLHLVERQWTRKPGIDSSLSSVPPVCPRPRPDIIGTGTPHAATSGARISDVLSPTPPVLCLSTLSRARSAYDAHAGPHHRVGEPRGLLRRSCRGARSPSAAPTPGNRAAFRRSRRRRKWISSRVSGRRPVSWMMSTARMGRAVYRREFTSCRRAPSCPRNWLGAVLQLARALSPPHATGRCIRRSIRRCGASVDRLRRRDPRSTNGGDLFHRHHAGHADRRRRCRWTSRETGHRRSRGAAPRSRPAAASRSSAASARHLQRFLGLLLDGPGAAPARGGPAQIWAEARTRRRSRSSRSTTRKCSRAKKARSPNPARRDDLWRSIVLSIVGGQQAVFDERARRSGCSRSPAARRHRRSRDRRRGAEVHARRLADDHVAGRDRARRLSAI